MSVSGVINTHFIVAYMIRQHGTEDQKQRFLPPMATGGDPWGVLDVGAGTGFRCRRDPHPGGAGRRRRLLDHRSEDVADQWREFHAGRHAGPHRRGCAATTTTSPPFLIEKPTGFGEVAPGLTIPGKLDKLGYKGIDTTELIFDGYRAAAGDVLSGAGRGFAQMMDGVEVGRVNVAARALRRRDPGVRTRGALRPAAVHLR